MAPMEQISGYIFRNTMQDIFGGPDKYFSPFITAAIKRPLRTKELKDVTPGNNSNILLVPQIMTKDAEGFDRLLDSLTDMGYRDINLNAGCPSGTVVAKGKGAGLLADPRRLDCLLAELFSVINITEEKKDIKISFSVKTRIGIESPSEWKDILEVYRKYPLSELIIHPRYREQFYNGKVDMDAFLKAFKATDFPVIFNGDIFDTDASRRLENLCPGLEGIMIGRGALMDPGLFRRIRTGKKTSKAELRLFYERLYEDYSAEMGANNAIMRLKELWHYSGMSFDPQTSGKALKAIKKSRSAIEYAAAVNELFHISELII